MILAPLLLLASAEAFFPLRPGLVWTYEDTINNLKETFVERTLPAQKVGVWENVVPILSTGGSLPPERIYYRIDNDTVFTVAYDERRPLSSPVPVLKVDTGKRDWNYRGVVAFLRGTATLDMKGTSKPGSERDVLNRKVKTINVEFSGTMTTDTGDTISSVQKAVYGEGIGLIEFEQTATIHEFKTTRKRKLIAFEEGKTEN